MKGVLLLARAHLTSALRERITLFWFLVFPILLLAILALVFGNTGQEGSIQFPIALVNEEGPTTEGSFSAMIVSIFEGMANPNAEGEPIFSLAEPDPGEDPASFLDREERLLRQGDLAAIIVIPDGFDDRLIRSFAAGPSAAPPALQVYINRNDAASQMASGIIEQVLAGVNRQILIRSGAIDLTDEVSTDAVWIGGREEGPSYIDFLLPGIILMGFFTAGLFGVPGTILFNRDRKILRRYWVSPLTVPRYLAGFSLGHLALCSLQFALLYAVGRYAFGARLDFARPDIALVLLLAVLTFMAFGFLIASIAKTANAGMALANVLNMPMMFLSGLFFPISGLPLFLLVIVYINPVSYLVDRLRAGLGVGTATMPAPLTIAVPLAWIALSAFVAAKRLRWDVER